MLRHALSQPYVGRVLPAVLDGLADENEGVREAALAAGRTLVELYAATSQQLLLPAVETGIVDDNWRIRHSSVELLGDLLFKVCGSKHHLSTRKHHLGTVLHGVAHCECTFNGQAAWSVNIHHVLLSGGWHEWQDPSGHHSR